MISPQHITDAVVELCRKASFALPADVSVALKNAFGKERNPLAKDLYGLFRRNASLARKKKTPLCQDTGTAVVFVEKGDQINLSDVDLILAVNKGVAKGYQKHYLRKSIIADPFDRKNTGTNTPAVVHFEPKKGRTLKITLLQKGGGAENCSALAMLRPSDGREGVLDFIVQTVKNAASKGCPPYIVGVGIGGNFEAAPYLAKKSLIRRIGSQNRKSFYAEMEKEALIRVNKLGIGPQGFGGGITAVAVNIETAPCHMASLPVAVNLECAMHRHSSVILRPEKI